MSLPAIYPSELFHILCQNGHLAYGHLFMSERKEGRKTDLVAAGEKKSQCSFSQISSLICLLR